MGRFAMSHGGNPHERAPKRGETLMRGMNLNSRAYFVPSVATTASAKLLSTICA
jgi:hypothetical protein